MYEYRKQFVCLKWACPRTHSRNTTSWTCSICNNVCMALLHIKQWKLSISTVESILCCIDVIKSPWRANSFMIRQQMACDCFLLPYVLVHVIYCLANSTIHCYLVECSMYNTDKIQTRWIYMECLTIELMLRKRDDGRKGEGGGKFVNAFLWLIHQI